MDLHRRKLWGDRAIWLLVAAATAWIVQQYFERGGQMRLYLVYLWGAVVLFLVFVTELRVGRREPRPGAHSLSAGRASYVGQESVDPGGRRTRTASPSTGGILEVTPQGVQWRSASEDSEIERIGVGWPSVYSWRIDGVVPIVWRASAYLSVLCLEPDGARRDMTFHVHGARRWRRALREGAILGPTYQRPDWLPDEPAAGLPVLLADALDPEGAPARVLIGAEATVPAYEPDPAPVSRPGPEPAPVVVATSPAREPVEVASSVGQPTLFADGVREAPQEDAPPAPSQPEDWEPVIGLECHVELTTASKVFCGCPTTFGAPPNSQVCPVCSGQPGTLPVLNRSAVEYALKIALALGCTVAPESVFHRKNYFYPDMPKNYQISQYDIPLAVNGSIEIELDGDRRRVRIHRVHLEEDTGKTTHGGAGGRIGEAPHADVDYNRAGVPLVEIVSEADMHTPDEARAYVTELRALLEAIGVSDVRMEEGSLRVDANVSVRRRGTEAFGTKVEVKNMNSIRSVQRALAFEIERQTEAITAGETIVQETRHFDEDAGRTIGGRSKEYSSDYRYFPDPDLVPLSPDSAWIESLRVGLPELPAQRRRRLEAAGSSAAEARALTATRALGDAFEEAVCVYGGDPKRIARWYLGELAQLANERGAEPNEIGVSPSAVAELQSLIDSGRVSDSMAKGDVLKAVVSSGRAPTDVVEEAGLTQISDADELGAIVDEVIAEQSGLVEQIRGGKTGAVNALVGQVMKRTKGAANPQVVRELLDERLGQ